MTGSVSIPAARLQKEVFLLLTVYFVCTKALSITDGKKRAGSRNHPRIT